MLYTRYSFNYRNAFLKVDRFYSIHHSRPRNNASESCTASLCGTSSFGSSKSIATQKYMFKKYSVLIVIYVFIVREKTHPVLLQYCGTIVVFSTKSYWSAIDTFNGFSSMYIVHTFDCIYFTNMLKLLLLFYKYVVKNLKCITLQLKMSLKCQFLIENTL